MKNIFIIILLISGLGTTFGQRIDDCSECDSKTYTELEIIDNELFEIELLRNEIFARHNYSFQNERLNEHFSKYAWRQIAETKSFSISDLNDIENKNIELFKKVESKIRKERLDLIGELNKLKSATLNNDTAKVESVLPGISSMNLPYRILKLVFQRLSIEDINWFKGKAQTSITEDNGRCKSNTTILISKNVVEMSTTSPMSHSDLMKGDEAFEYPSEYYSEEENTLGIELLFKDGKLIFNRFIAID